AWRKGMGALGGALAAVAETEARAVSRGGVRLLAAALRIACVGPSSPFDLDVIVTTADQWPDAEIAAQALSLLASWVGDPRLRRRSIERARAVTDPARWGRRLDVMSLDEVVARWTPPRFGEHRSID
ncbi:MAG: hypothetical protein ABMB14_35950, partial [Myxococcota bacterium]